MLKGRQKTTLGRIVWNYRENNLTNLPIRWGKPDTMNWKTAILFRNPHDRKKKKKKKKKKNICYCRDFAFFMYISKSVLGAA